MHEGNMSDTNTRSAEEIAAHEEQLDTIAGSSGGQVLWRTLAGTE